MKNKKSMQSLGGEARAKALTSEERSEIARSGAMAKWEKSEIEQKIPKAAHVGELKIGDLIIPCAVLENGERVIADRTLANTLGIKGSGAYWQKKKGGEEGALLPEYISAKYLTPYVTEEIRKNIMNSISYKPINGPKANGIKAALLPEICDVWLKAKEKGALTSPQQLEVAEKAYILLRAFATVGIIALVDEATGYQELRDRKALQEILKQYISGKLLEWTKTFPLDFYKEIFRLKGWPWNGGKMPSVVGKYTNDLVYDRLAPGVLEELKRLNPVNEKGHRPNRLHQFLTREIGHPALSRRLYELIGMARPYQNGDWEKYCNLIDRIFPKLGSTIPFAFGD